MNKDDEEKKLYIMAAFALTPKFMYLSLCDETKKHFISFGYHPQEPNFFSLTIDSLQL